MNTFLSYAGLRDNFPFKLESTTAEAVKADPNAIIGKVVTITGNYEVGYGSDADEPFGVVTAIEPFDIATDASFIVTVAKNQSFEGIAHTGDATAGGYLVCDGTGKVKNSVEASRCICLGTESGNLCTIVL